MLKVLIVEDEAITAIMLAETLRDRGYDIARPVATGDAAVAAAAAFHPDIILMDVHLAGPMDGIQAARIIGTRQRTAFIFMTGYSDDGAQKELEQLHPLARLLKPVSPEAIDAAIRQSGIFKEHGGI